LAPKPEKKTSRIGSQMKNIIKRHVVEEESQKKEIHHKQKSSSQTVGKQESNA
jgi:hypothetical protein